MFVDLSAANDTIDHCLLLEKVFDITEDSNLPNFFGGNAQKQTYLCAAEQQKERSACAKEWSSSRKCACPNVVQHIHER